MRWRRTVLRAWPMPIAFCAAYAWAGDERVSPDLNGGKSASDIDVIVQYKSASDAAHHQRVASLGGRLHESFERIHAPHYTIPANSLDELENDADVAYVTPDRAVRATAIIAGPVSQLDLIGQAVDNTNHWRRQGQGIGVAGIASGIACRQSFAGVVVWGASGAAGCNIVRDTNVVWGNANTAAESSTVTITGNHRAK